MIAKNTANTAQQTTQQYSGIKSYPCPQCKKPTQWQHNSHKPFCSERCKLIDFGAWADEAYKIPSEQADWSQN